MNSKRIFVSVASFCDPLLEFTIRNAVATARHPERLSFGIVEQNDVSVESALPTGRWRTAFLHVNPRHSRGACWARALAMTLYAGEEYFFQIDSHTCFDQHWDVTLIDTLEQIDARSGNAKVAISIRPFAFEIDDDGSIRTKRFTETTLRLTPTVSVIKRSEPVLQFASEDTKHRDDVAGFQISAAYLFTRGHFAAEVPYDPLFYFHGEEQNISIRAFTHGWDIWHPNAVPLYHLYKKRGAKEAPLHWDADFESQRQEKWFELRRRADRRLGELMTGKLSGAYGLGSVRTFDDYLKVSGLRLEDVEG
ncbi:GlcNAc-transferase family protein [Hyphomicrobium sp. D-2]|uniref:GlcNAc-transferase family protein n=1 Tax=Hyphomicrobium sp. D-2 TaxID=3041621 RepID=UPI002455D11D|nr:GlcNAc-transferase family protein [Hyphomicrobium sp. D-2]MDH4982129.1 GlcNAc-transferase family protein [Hyphomicrobium sp. D-2]